MVHSQFHRQAVEVSILLFNSIKAKLEAQFLLLQKSDLEVCSLNLFDAISHQGHQLPLFMCGHSKVLTHVHVELSVDLQQKVWTDRLFLCSEPCSECLFSKTLQEFKRLTCLWVPFCLLQYCASFASRCELSIDAVDTFKSACMHCSFGGIQKKIAFLRGSACENIS